MTRHSGTLLSKYYKRLADYDLFKDIAPSNLEAVLNCVKARITTYPKNTFLVLEKDDISIAGLILEGNVAMLKEDDQGHQSMITYMREGELFGEVFSLARDHTSIVSYRTMTRCTVMYLSVSKVLNTCQNDCRNQAQTKRHLIGNHLNGTTHRGNYRILVVRTPTGKEYSDNAD